MKRIFNLLLIAAVFCGLSSCWKEEIPEAGAARPQIKELKAVPGDEEVQLSWSVPEGYTATDFLIKYTTPQSETVEVRTGGLTECLVTDLQNEYNYKFDVQAIYGNLISNIVSAAGKPTTSRFAVTDLAAEPDNGMVTLFWTKPATSVLDYTLTYFNEKNPGEVKEVKVDKDAEKKELTGLENDVNYTFSLVANYTKGASEPATVKAMPSAAVPFFLDRTSASIGQPVTFTFNTEGYPTATEVKWTFPGDVVKEGNEVKHAFGSTGAQIATLSAKIDGRARSWKAEVVIREYVLNFKDWAQDGANYNGFKGSCPVFSPDGKTVYNITFNKITSLYAFDVITGEEKWHYTPAKANSYNPLTVNPVTGDIYFGTTAGGQFYAVTAEGKLKWAFDEVGSMQAAAPAVSKDGSKVFVVDATGSVFALNAADGKKIWGVKPALAGKGGGLLVNGNELIVGMVNKNIYFLNVNDGSVIAEVPLAANMTDISGFAVSNDKKTIYVPHAGGKISSVDIVNHKAIVNGFQVGGDNLYEPVVAPDGTVFAGCKDGKAYNVSADLTKVNWTYDSTVGKNAYNYSHPCVDSEGNFYITSGGGSAGNFNVKLSPVGKEVEKWTYGSSKNQKQMGGNNFLDGVLYSAFIGAADDNGLFVGKYVGGERAATWSTHGGDICGSCCIK